MQIGLLVDELDRTAMQIAGSDNQFSPDVSLRITG